LRSGQYDNLEGAAVRVLDDDGIRTPVRKPPATKNALTRLLRSARQPLPARHRFGRNASV